MLLQHGAWETRVCTCVHCHGVHGQPCPGREGDWLLSLPGAPSWPAMVSGWEGKGLPRTGEGLPAAQGCLPGATECALDACVRGVCQGVCHGECHRVCQGPCRGLCHEACHGVPHEACRVTPWWGRAGETRGRERDRSGACTRLCPGRHETPARPDRASPPLLLPVPSHQRVETPGLGTKPALGGRSPLGAHAARLSSLPPLPPPAAVTRFGDVPACQDRAVSPPALAGWAAPSPAPQLGCFGR